MSVHYVHTVGHSTRSLLDLVSVLRHYDVELLVDIRGIPRSRHTPQFNSEELDADLPRYGLGYVHLPELGGRRPSRDGSPNTGWRNKSFRGYADHMETDEFAEVRDWLIETSARVPTAVMCAESLWWRCHRRMLADGLLASGCRVVHIMEGGRRDTHRLHPAARLERGLPVYDLEVEEETGQARLAD